jgi:hypothetical protein
MRLLLIPFAAAALTVDAGAALLVLQSGPNFQQAVEHFGTLSAACGELSVGLFVHVLEAMKLIGDVQRRQDGDFQRVDSESSR